MRIEFQVNIQAPIALVYQVSQDYSVRYEWDAFPENIALLNGAEHIEKGVCVSITAKSGLKMEVEFVQVMPPTTAAIRMKKGPLVLESSQEVGCLELLRRRRPMPNLSIRSKRNGGHYPWCLNASPRGIFPA